MLLQTVPLSTMIKVDTGPAMRGKVEYTLECASAIHGCWLLADDIKVDIDFAVPANIRGTKMIQDNDGLYSWNDFPPKIFIAPNATCTEFVILHEIGHYLDHWHLDLNRQFATRAGNRMPDIENWYNEVQKTPLYDRLQNYDLSKASNEEKKDIEYLKHPTELWACSYAQYIAESSSCGELSRQMRQYCVENIFECRQWPTQDFKPVSTAIEQILDQRGWL